MLELGLWSIYVSFMLSGIYFHSNAFSYVNILFTEFNLSEIDCQIFAVMGYGVKGQG